MLSDEALDIASARAIPFAVDIHDDPIAQNAALGIPGTPDWVARATARKRRNLDAFRWLIAPSEGIAELAGLDPERTIIAGNGTDTTVVQPQPWPAEPAIGMISGAAPARGIETLVEATEVVREAIPDVKLLLWLAATGEESGRYLDDLRTRLADRSWIEIATLPYDQIGASLGRATIQCIPTPPSRYWDAVSPIKLFDAMASGRPVVVTPRNAMRSDVERHGAGLVSPSDGVEDLARTLERLLRDPALARRAGASGRAAAVAEHDWGQVSARLADELLRRAE